MAAPAVSLENQQRFAAASFSEAQMNVINTFVSEQLTSAGGEAARNLA